MSVVSTSASASPKTLYDKLWDMHTVTVQDNGTTILYVDRHLIHEVTPAQAFEGIKLAGRKLWRPKSIIATPDHQVPTENQHLGNSRIEDLRAVAKVVEGLKVSPTTKRAMIVPGSGLIKEQAEKEGLDNIFLAV